MNKFLESLEHLTAKQVVLMVIAIVFLSPGLKAGLEMVGGAVSFIAGFLK